MYKDNSARCSPQTTPTPTRTLTPTSPAALPASSSLPASPPPPPPSPVSAAAVTAATEIATGATTTQTSNVDVAEIFLSDDNYPTNVANNNKNNNIHINSQPAEGTTTIITTASALEKQDTEDDILDCLSSSDSEVENVRHSHGNTNTTTTTTTTTTTATTALATVHATTATTTIETTTATSTEISTTTTTTATTTATFSHHHTENHANPDVRLLRKIGYIASRVRFLAKLYGDFKLVNPYSPTKQRKQLQEILLRHALPVHLLLPPSATDNSGTASTAPVTASTTRSLTPVSGSLTASSCCLPTDNSHQPDDDENEDDFAEDPNDDDEDDDPTQTTTTGTVRRKSSAGGSTIAANASIHLLEDILVRFYEDRRNKITLIQRRRSPSQSSHNHLIIMSSRTMSSSVERLLHADSNDNDNDDDDLDNARLDGIGTAFGVGVGVGVPVSRVDSDAVKKSPPNLFKTQQSSQQQQQQHKQQPPHSYRSNSLLQPSSALCYFDDPNARRRRASDCCAYTHIAGQSGAGQTAAAGTATTSWSNQLQVTLKNNNCTKFPFHRGSCGAAGEHFLAANSIANRSTIILSKSCGNVDGSDSNDGSGGNIGGGGGGGGGNGLTSAALCSSSDLRHTTAGSNGKGSTGGAALSGAGGAGSGGGGGGGGGFGGGGGGGGVGAGASDIAATNGSNEYSIVQLNNTIIQCHFNDDDFRALVKELKRKVEYTERMNWLCLSNRPMGPPNRKSSLPKHQEVKQRFLELCNTTFSEEVTSALRLPAFDSYEWSDADVIHLMQTMFIELGFIEKFNIPADTLREWLYEVYKHYNEVPFHNFRHCFCVAQMMYAITRQANLLQRLGDLECLILLVSCICHDLDHPGYNNIYQINARTELALRYNDISPLENHHCSIAFRLLEHPECNIFKNFSRDTFNQIREGIIRCILATDMARHNEILTQFKEITPIFDYSNRAHINLLCMVLIKVADISNEARPMDVAEPWLDRLLQEFFAQSAAEKSEGLPVTPFMDPDKVSKPGSQVRFIGLVLLPLFEALGDLVPELIDLIIIPVRVALDYYKRLNDAQNRARKSVADGGGSSSQGASENNSGASDGAPVIGGGGAGPYNAATSASGGSISPQMPRSQSGISVKSRRSIPSQKSASRTSVDEPQCIAAELHDLPEGSESGDSETATEVDVAEKTSKFKVDTEGSSNRSKSSHSTSRKSSREKRPSMIGELCSSGGGQRIRNSYGNIHGQHSNRNQFGSNRAVSLDQYSANRRLSDGLPQVISDSNVFYNRQNRGSLEASTGSGTGTGSAAGSAHKFIEDLNMNSTAMGAVGGVLAASLHVSNSHNLPNVESGGQMCGAVPMTMSPAAAAAAALAALNQNQHPMYPSSNGNLSPTQILQPKHPCCVAAAAAAAAAAAGTNGVGGTQNTATGNGTGVVKSSWKARFKQFSDYFSFSFDKNTSKRLGSSRSSPCSVRNNNAATGGGMVGSLGGGSGSGGVVPLDPMTGKPGICCTISNNLQSPGLRHKQHSGQHQDLRNAGRNRAYSLDVPCSHSNPRYSSSSGGGGDSSRKSSRHDGTAGAAGTLGTLGGSASGGGGGCDDNNSNNTLHSSGAVGSEMPICLPPPIRIGSVDASDTILIATGLPRAITPAALGDGEPSLSIDLGMASCASYDPPKI